jgi:adenylate cyclase
MDPREFLTLTAIASVHFFSKRFEETLEWTSRVLEQRPSWVAALRYRAAALAHLGRIDEAKEVIEKSKLVQPHGRIGRMSIYKFRHRWMHDLYLDGLRKAGLPE